MNERIKELMEQAGIDVEAVESLGEMPTALKFTQLIVAECEEVVRWAISVDSTIEKVPVLIREHFRVDFGVEP